jgi:hypothetical protein
MKTSAGEVLMAQCAKCREVCEEAELQEMAGQQLCEDCYVDSVQLSKTCDPWAVHSAKNLIASQGVRLTADQERLLELVKKEKEIGFHEAANKLGMKDKQLQEDFTVLRHMEVLRAQKRADVKVITL